MSRPRSLIGWRWSRRKLAQAHAKEARFLILVVLSCQKLGRLYQNIGKPEQALPVYREQLAAIEKIVAEKPGVMPFTVFRGAAHHDLGQVANTQKRDADALAEFDRAIPFFQEVLDQKQMPQLHAGCRDWLRTSHGGRAYALYHLQRPKDAVAAFDQALRLTAGRQREWFELRRAGALAASGVHAEPVAVVDAAMVRKDIAAADLYEAACVLALASVAVTKDGKLSAPTQKQRAEEYAARAVALLARAKTAGYFRSRAMVAHLNADSDLDCLRNRADYRRFVAELDKKTTQAK